MMWLSSWPSAWLGLADPSEVKPINQPGRVVEVLGEGAVTLWSWQ